MRRLIAAALMSMTVAASAAPTSQPATPVDQLITQLGSDDFHARQSAADQLVDCGDAVRPQIEKLAADTSDAERRNLAAGILTRLDRLARQGPTFITLHVHDADAEKVLAHLAAQAKTAIHFSPNALRGNRLPAVSLDVDHKLFWLALNDLCRLTRTHAQVVEGSTAIELGTGRDTDALDGPTCVAGPFMVAAVAATHNSQVRYGATVRGTNTSSSIEFAIYTDPRAHPLDTPTPTLDEATDEAGHSLLTSLQQRSRGGPRGKWLRSFICDLTPRTDSHTLKRLRGSIDTTFAVESQTITIPDIQAGLHKVAGTGDVSVEPTACYLNGGHGSYTLAFRRTTAGVLNLQGLKLFDAADDQLYDGKVTVVNTPADAYTISSSFTRQTPIKLPITLQWTVPTRTETVHSVFEFDDLPLP